MQQNLAHDIDSKPRTEDVILEENTTFTSLLLSTEIKSGLAENGFKKPSPIQLKAIPLGRCGFDLIVKSKSGTGKTLVFTTVALEAVNVAKSSTQVLILVPTREIAVQIQEVIKRIGCHIDGLFVQSFIGGLPLEEDITKAKQCHIAVGAPGRVKHLINLGALSIKSIKLFVLDEADKLMEATFKNDINEIYENLPVRKQIIASSATYPKELDTFLGKYMLSPTHVTSENETPMLLGLRQFVSILKPNALNAVQQMKAKNEILLEIFAKVSFTQCLVFTNYQTRTESVCNFLNQNNWNASFISAAIDQTERLEAINNLKSFKNRILLSTDLTARGIDASNVDLVINYDIPRDAVTYLHRMGRAGRYGSSGICINFALERLEIDRLQIILGTIGATNLSISILPPLDGIDLWQLDLNKLDQISGVVPTEASNDIKEDIKQEILTLKQKKRDKNEVKAKKKIKLEEICNTDSVQQFLNNRKKEVEENVDTEKLLMSLTSEVEDENNKKRKRCQQIKVEKTEDAVSYENEEIEQNSVDSEELLASLIDNTKTDNEESKKRKLNENVYTTGETFIKNKALLSISKLLTNSNYLIDQDIVTSINDYLGILKTVSFDVTSLSPEEILTSSEATISPKTECDIIDNIFQIGFEYAVENKGTEWLNRLPNDELEKFQNFCRSETVDISEESEEEEEDSMQVEESEEIAIPSERSPDLRNERHYLQCFEDCSSVLWQTGLTFENVQNFDNWYIQWESQLESVRNYVQQNIYIEEMSQYQHTRLNNE